MQRVKMFGLIQLGVVIVMLGLASPVCLGEAAWVWHGNNRVPYRPTADSEVEVWVKVGYQNWVDKAFVYMTEDGSEPQGAFGIASAGTAVEIFWDHLEWDENAQMYADWWKGLLPGGSAGSVVRYKIGVWHSGGGAERFADNSMDSSEAADTFSYYVQGEAIQSRRNEVFSVTQTVDVPGVTGNPGPAENLDVQLWTDVAGAGFAGYDMAFDSDDGTGDRFAVDVTPANTGIFHFLVRFRVDDGEWQYLGNPADENTMNRFIIDPEWIRDTVFYQVFPRVQNAKDMDGDGDLSNDEFGGFAEVIADLDRIAALGVTGLYVMPIHPLTANPEYIKSSDGVFGSPYAPMDYRAVNSDYGTEAEFQQLVDQAHAKGMKVIIGFVPNHLAPDNVLLDPLNPVENGGYHPDWFEQDEFGNPKPDQTEWWDTVALNYTCSDQAAMREFVTQALGYWIDTFGVDGFRCDMAYFQPIDFWVDAIDALRATRPDFVLIAEAYDMEPELEYAGFTAVYDHRFYKGLFDEVRFGTLDAAGFRQRLLDTSASHIQGSLPFRYLENHDEERAMTAFGDGSVSLAAMMILSRSTCMIYGGQEAGISRRVPLFRGWNDVFVYPYLDFDHDPAITESYQKLLAFRKGSPAVNTGKEMLPECSNQNIFTLARWLDNERILAAFNLDLAGGAQQTGSIDIPEAFNLDENKTYAFTDIMLDREIYFNAGVSDSLSVNLPSKSFVAYTIGEACEYGGDINDDGFVDADDELILLQGDAGLFSLDQDENCRGDYNLSGNADMLDILAWRHGSESGPAQAEIILGEYEASPGDQVYVDVVVTEPQVQGLTFKLTTAPALEIAAYEFGLDQCLGASDLNPCPDGRDCADPVKGVFQSAQVSANPTASDDQIWVRILFCIPEDAVPGSEYSLSGQGRAGAGNGSEIPVSCRDGKITVINNAPCGITGVEIVMPDHSFYPGSNCFLDVNICNAGNEDYQDLPFFCLLEVFGDYFYYPNWRAKADWQMLDLLPGKTGFTLTLIEPFQWPATGTTAENLNFLAALVNPEFTEILGEMDTWTFSYY